VRWLAIKLEETAPPHCPNCSGCRKERQPPAHHRAAGRTPASPARSKKAAAVEANSERREILTAALGSIIVPLNLIFLKIAAPQPGLTSKVLVAIYQRIHRILVSAADVGAGAFTKPVLCRSTPGNACAILLPFVHFYANPRDRSPFRWKGAPDVGQTLSMGMLTMLKEINATEPATHLLAVDAEGPGMACRDAGHSWAA
jgi:hypothetical protein